VVNKIDRPDARISEVVDEVYELFIDLGADAAQIEFPIVYCNAKKGLATLDPAVETTNLDALFETLLEHVPPPDYDPEHPMQALVTNLDASPYVGRLALCRMRHGTIRKGQQIAWCRASDGSVQRAKVAELFITQALDRVDAESAGPGDIIAVAGLPDVTIGDTLADPDDPRPLAELSVEEPSMSVVIGINTSPIAGRDGTKLTARMVRQRLDQELVGNVSIRVLDTERPDAWEVQGRGELQLAVLVEMMRREGFELTVGRPQAVTREIEGRVFEPVERLVVEVPEEHMGAVTQLLAARKGQMQGVQNHGDTWVRMTYTIPTRGLIGIRTQMLTETRGTAVLHQLFEGWEPWHGPMKARTNGSLVADRTGVTTMFSLMSLQERGNLFVGPGEEVYEGAIIGENARQDDMDVNPTKEKKLNNIRSSTAEELVRLNVHRTLTLDEALEMVRDDECVEVTPNAVRLRKVELSQTNRAKNARASKPPRTT
jgi:GTP-binding protein